MESLPIRLIKKIIDCSYYIDLGRIAYERLNAINPIAFDQENFYQVLSDEILKIIEIIKQASQTFLGVGNEPFLLKLEEHLKKLIRSYLHTKQHE